MGSAESRLAEGARSPKHALTALTSVVAASTGTPANLTEARPSAPTWAMLRGAQRRGRGDPMSGAASLAGSVEFTPKALLEPALGEPLMGEDEVRRAPAFCRRWDQSGAARTDQHLHATSPEGDRRLARRMRTAPCVRPRINPIFPPSRGGERRRP